MSGEGAQRPSLREAGLIPVQKPDECLRCWRKLTQDRQAICVSCTEKLEET